MRDLIRHILREELEEKQLRERWTLDKVLSIASNFEYMNDFKKSNPRAYNAMRNNGWIDDVRKIMKPKQISWTFEMAKSLVDNYSNFTEFSNEQPRALAAIKRNGWEELLDTLNKTHHNWTDEDIRKEALKYNTLNDFRKYSRRAWDASINHGIYDEVTHHMNRTNIQWTNEMLEKEALKYKTRSDFMKGSRNAYQSALSRGILDDICGHMEQLGNFFKRLVYVYEFPDNSVYVGLTLNKNQRSSRHKVDKKSTVFKHIQETGLEPTYKVISDDYINAEDAQNMEDCTIQEYRNNGWKILNIAKAGGLGNTCLVRWTKELVHQEALKYNTITQFTENSRSAHNAAKRNGWLPEITKHMLILKQRWTKDKLYDVMSRYSNMNDFRKNDYSAFGAAYRILGNEGIKEYYNQ